MRMISALSLVKQVQRSIPMSKGYHVYKNIWKPIVNEEMETEMEPDNVKDKYLVYVKKKTSIVRHLTLSKNGKFAKVIF